MHGIAVNVENDLSLFDCIIPCGLKGMKMCSVQSFKPNVTLKEYTYVIESFSDLSRECYLEMFKKYFEVDFFEGSTTSPRDDDQTIPMPEWASNYYSTPHPVIERKKC